MKIDVVTVDGSPRGITTLDIENGVGGAELALITWAETMVKRGHNITIYNNPKNEGVFNGVEYRNNHWFNPELANRDAVITFRGPNKQVYWHNGTRKYIGWSCDQLTVGDYVGWYNFVDKMVLISDFHKDDHFLRYSLNQTQMNKITVLDLGVRNWEYQDRIPKKKQAIYCSIADRGLNLLFDMWPQIRKILPEYELVVTSDYRLWGSPDAGNGEYKLKSVGMKGIRFLGKVPRSELVKLQLESELHLFPCIYPENFCISVAECQVAGAIPITSDTGAIQTTNISGFKVHTKINHPNFQKDYLDAVRIYSELGYDEKNSIKNIMIAEAQNRFDWNKICEKWEELLNE